jgi:uncharacterized damage-inducible protein DinB
MNIAEGYDYLVRARRDLWATLEGVGDEVLSRQLLNGAKMHCVKDIVFHVVSVEDFWMQGEILREQPVRKSTPGFEDTRGGPAFAGCALKTLLDYWRAVEQRTLTYLGTLTEDELKRVVSVHDRPGRRYTVDGLLWNLIIHEARHVAQISVLLRTQGIEPPFLDLLRYWPMPAA